MISNQAKLQNTVIPFVDFKRRYASLKMEVSMGVDDVLASGSYILGEVVEEFEHSLAQYLDCRHVLGVANGTDAIILALKVLKVGAGDEVIVPVNSFVATAGAVVAVNAKPVFCDVRDDLNIDVKSLEKLITKKTKAIIPVHLTGRPADMEAITKIANYHSLAVIEDAAQSIGAKCQGKMTGVIGDVGCFSLHPLKNLHVYGDGGVITTNNEDLYNQLKLIRNHGLLDRDTCIKWGLNSRLDSVQAKIALIGMKYLNKWNERRRETARLYQENLCDFVKVPVDNESDFSVYHNFVILTHERELLMHYLQERGIETKVHYPIPLHLQLAAADLGYRKGDFPVAERLAQQMLSLPVYPELTDDEVTRVIQTIQGFFIGKK
ncbi:MAG: cell wall biogenesis protein [Gammaproteobacteria bacterium RIFCSPHIGHO2_12_FULL_37_14]|nr:MAG: cell wall biogenesis protein [Gammaproteobacteria bacterium RIFCSPHIGHO2_12_FULL_37_14]